MNKFWIGFLLSVSAICFADDNFWTPTSLYGQCCNEFVFDPLRRSVVFGFNSNGEIFKSVNLGKNWKSHFFPYKPAEATGIVLRVSSSSNSSNLFLVAAPYFFRSENDGRTWQRIGEIPALRYVHDFEIDSNDSRIIYVGGAIVAQKAWQPVVFRSIDGGKTWKKLLAGLSGRVMHIELHPFISGIVYARDARSIFKSIDAGNTWTKSDSIPDGTTAFTIDPADGKTLYASAKDVFKSIDDGKTWRGLGTSLVTRSIAVDHKNPQIIYAAGIRDLKKSIDGGETWNTLKLSPSIDGYDPWTVAVSPHNSNLVLSSNFQGASYRSTDGGQSFALITEGGAGRIAFIFPSKKTFGKLLASGNAIFHTLNNGKSWQASSMSIPSSKNISVTKMQVHPLDENLVYALIFSYNHPEPSIYYVAKSLDGGFQWSFYAVNGSVIDMAVDPANTNVIYLAQFRKVMRSTDGGKTWSILAEDFSPQRISSIAVDPSKPARLFVCTAGPRIYRSLDSGRTWKLSDQGIISDNTFGLEIDFDPFKPGVAFAFHGFSLYKSNDGGKSWLRSGAGLNLSRRNGNVLISFTAHPTQNDVFFITAIADYTRPLIFVSTNGGSFWEPFTVEGLSFPIDKLAISSISNHYFLGTDHGLYTYRSK